MYGLKVVNTRHRHVHGTLPFIPTLPPLLFQDKEPVGAPDLRRPSPAIRGDPQASAESSHPSGRTTPHRDSARDSMPRRESAPTSVDGENEISIAPPPENDPTDPLSALLAPKQYVMEIVFN